MNTIPPASAVQSSLADLSREGSRTGMSSPQTQAKSQASQASFNAAIRLIESTAEYNASRQVSTIADETQGTLLNVKL